MYRMSQDERAKLRDGVPYVKLYRYNPKFGFTVRRKFQQNV